MNKLKEILADRRPVPLWLALVSALFFYSMYSFRFEFWDWSNLPLVGLYAALSGILFGLAFLLLWTCFRTKKKRIAFLCGVAGFEAILWTVLTLVNVDGLNNRGALYTAYAILYSLYALICVITLLKNAKTGFRWLQRLLAGVLGLVFLFLAAQPALPGAAQTVRALNFTDSISYQPLPAEETALTEDEKNTARTWFERHVLFSGGSTPAYDFLLGGERFSEHTQDWAFTVSDPVPDGRGGETVTVTGKHPGGVELRVEGTFYAANAGFTWTVWLRNTGSADSPVISDFCALTGGLADLPLFDSAELYCSLGSHDAAEDFTPMRVRNPKKTHTFTGVGGRPSDAWMPFFNLCGADFGAVLGIGWTGQWLAEIAARDGVADMTVRQQTFEAYLTPGEEVRSPLVSLHFYTGGNPVKGINQFRRWVLDSVYPANTPYVLDDLDVLFVSHTRTAAEIVADVKSYDPAHLQAVDHFWMDAGWYAGCEESWSDGNGNWTAAEARFPKGIREISDLAAESGCGLVLWYEPERLVHGSALWEAGQQHPEWIIDLDPSDPGNADILWNLADADARRYLTEYISKSLLENGVRIYRQDFNTEPLEKWEYADANYYGGRRGICENHYVTGLYAYLDGLFAAVPGLIMDNCASGGRRLDLEMTRRSIPLWRSDYNCKVYPDSTEATQAHTFGLSFWQPVSGVNVNFGSEYGARSSIFGGNLFTYDSCETEYFGAYTAEREMLVKNFYPISYGGVNMRKITAMQYGDETAGQALIYKHKRAKTGSYPVYFSGVEADAAYKVWSVDDPSLWVRLTGGELMAGKYSVVLPAGEKALIVKYEKF